MAKIISLVYCAKNSAVFDTLKDTYNAGDYNLSDLGTADDWAMGFIEVALVVKVMSGNEDNTFTPQGNVTRAETATVTFRILGLVIETPTATPTIAPTSTPTPTLAPLLAIRSHGEKLSFASITLSNYPEYIQGETPPTEYSILADGVANDFLGSITCNLDKPEYLFDLGSLQSIQSFAIAGYNSKSQTVPFKLFLSEDLESWIELGSELKIAQPVIADKSIYIKENFDDALNTNRMNPAPTKFDTTTEDENIAIGNYQFRDLLDTVSNEITVQCLASPQMDTTITSIDWQAYGFVDDNCNYLFHYFIDEIQTARYVKIIGYGNSMTAWHAFSSFTEVQVFGLDAVITD